MVDGVESEYTNVDIGVPQGSVLGPLLFLIYINDVINSSKLLTFSLFADDTVVLYSNKNVSLLISTMNKELKKLDDWFKCNKLFLNFNKTKYIIFRSKNKKIPHDIDPILINNVIIERTETINFLGIIIHESFDWKYHIMKISSKLSRSIGVLHKLKTFLPLKILIYIYNAIILPHLNYGNEIWGNSYKIHTNKILLLQKRAIRIISNSHQYVSHSCSGASLAPSGFVASLSRNNRW